MAVPEENSTDCSGSRNTPCVCVQAIEDLLIELQQGEALYSHMILKSGTVDEASGFGASQSYLKPAI